jgi:hypothetical protein
VRRLQEEQERKIREEEEREAAELKALEDERERKRKARQDKVEAQKASGTYMTKSEKEKAKKAQAKLEVMKAAGMVVPALQGSSSGATAAKQSDLFKRPSKPAFRAAAAVSCSAAVTPIEETARNEEAWRDDTDAADDAVAMSSTTAVTEAVEEADDDVLEDWDAAGSDEDWETTLDKVTLDVKGRGAEDEDEDEIELDKRQQHEKLKALGIERAKRDEELRLKRWPCAVILCSGLSDRSSLLVLSCLVLGKRRSGCRRRWSRRIGRQRCGRITPGRLGTRGMRMPELQGPRRTCAPPSRASWVMWILAKLPCSIKFVTPMSRRARREASLSRSGSPSSLRRHWRPRRTACRGQPPSASTCQAYW